MPTPLEKLKRELEIVLDFVERWNKNDADIAVAEAVQAIFDALGKSDSEKPVECEHQCSGNCRRVGCNCECGEFHKPQEEKPRERIEELEFTKYESYGLLPDKLRVKLNEVIHHLNTH